MQRTLKQTADYFGITRPELISRMREADLLNRHNLPQHASRDRLYLTTKEGSWWHPECGHQYSLSTRVTQPGIPWLAERLSLSLPPVKEDHHGAA
ncbi:phage antirepressor KilAC domain-containing protein [Pokkaliibacter sp. MBI-7]|uniref:phage antirepressor KilAC domain-containing protein n=1 Tax=Pokkaliibacter sp. MBI-7 TaxID=3040600 RepID=UPI00244C2BE3|nr:phage antirepressor KilAC domain-containing protein [Pokkaliibacter sp. MBI-7]MDH2435639.1 phage antirepressor KilAC domain-containing protein [Pokkaliibacter sp. MBI-7]